MPDDDNASSHAIAHPRKRAFLAAYARTKNVTVAAEAAGIHRRTHYDWIDADEDGSYRAALADAAEEAIERLEAEALRRSVQGVRRPVTYQGKVVYWDNPETGKHEVLYERRYSDYLTGLLLKAARPEKYKERHEVTGGDGGPIKVAEMRADIRRLMECPDAFELLSKLAESLEERPLVDVKVRPPPNGLPGDGNSKGGGHD